MGSRADSLSTLGLSHVMIIIFLVIVIVAVKHNYIVASYLKKQLVLFEISKPLSYVAYMLEVSRNS